MKTELGTLKSLLDDFDNNLENRSTQFLLWLDIVLPKILEWRYFVWKNLWIEGETEDFNDWYELQSRLNSIIKKISERSYTDKASQYFFVEKIFKNFKKHVERYKSEQQNDRFYYDDALDIFFQIFFEFENKASDSDKEYFWQSLPIEWKVTKTNLENGDIFACSFLNHFIGWAKPRIWNPVSEFDTPLNSIVNNLFPEVDPNIWARILIFVYTPYEEAHRVNSVISHKLNFGFNLRRFITTDLGNDAENRTPTGTRNQESDKTYELALFLFPQEFSSRLLKEYIAETITLRYETKSEEIRRLKLLQIFESLLRLRA